MKILIAEDEENSRILLKDILESEGYDVISAENGKEALELIKKHRPHMIITDILMPEMDGFELCRKLKKDTHLKSIPVIFYTATYTTHNDKEYAMSLGASRFIIKPMEPDLFIREIKDVIDEAKENKLTIPQELGESEEKLTERYSNVLRNKLEHKINVLQNEINEHKRARAELLTSQKQLGMAVIEIDKAKSFLNNILESMPSILIALDNDNKIIQWNNAAVKYLEIEHNKALNTDLFLLIPGLLPLKDDIALVIKSDSPHNIHKTSFECFKNKFFNVSLFPLRTKSDNKKYIVIRFDDISEFVTVEEQLAHSRRMEIIGQLSGGIAHDFNNQLSGLLAYTELIKYKYGDDEELMSYADKIIMGIKRSSELIQKLLTFSRKGKYMTKPFDLHNVIEEVISILKHSIDKKIKIHKDCNAHNFIIDGDATQMQNAILNLGINASDAMPYGGDLSFSTENLSITDQNKKMYPDLENGDCIMLHVQDTGIGMDTNTLKQIFEPFFTTKDPQHGSGMGLAAVHKTIENHKGFITVKSEQGKGTLFTVYIPTSDKEMTETVKKDTPVAGTAKILLVEDELIIRESLREILQTLGYCVIPCENGEQAIKEYENCRKEIDLIILDIMMPGLNGFETYNHIKNIQPHVKIIFISGYNETPEMEELMGQKNIDFIRKPLNTVSLTKKIANLLKNEG